MKPSLILASSSPTRSFLLEQAGVDFAVVKSGVDEEATKISHQKSSPQDTAAILAREKALAVSEKFPDHWVIGADQILDVDGNTLSKARTPEQARKQLQLLRGKSHFLPTSVALVHQQQCQWQTTETPRLTMRTFSEKFLDRVLENIRPEDLNTVGCYRIEAATIQLFQQIEGSWTTIMGLPLLPLLEALRQHNIIPA